MTVEIISAKLSTRQATRAYLTGAYGQGVLLPPLFTLRSIYCYQ